MAFPTRRLFVSTLILTLAFLARSAQAQSPSSGAVSGVIADSLGLPLQGINLTLRSVRSGMSRAASSTREGEYRFALLAPDDYELRVEGFGFHPLWLTGIRVQAAQELRVPLTLAATEPTGARLDSARYDGGAAIGSTTGRGRLITRAALEALPDRSRDLGELVRLSSMAGDALEMEGLPGTMTQIRLDGVPGAAAPFLVASASARRGMSIPWIGLEAAEVAAAGADVEWGGTAGGVLNTISRSGTRDFSAQGFGAWSQATVDPAVPAGDGLDSDGLRGGFLISGPIARDTSAFVIGVETSRARSLLHPGRGVDSLTTNFARIADEEYEVGLPTAGWIRSLQPQVVSAFGRLEWRLSDAHQLRVGVNAGTTTDADASLFPHRSPFGTSVEGSELGAFAVFSSRLGQSVWHELRAGFERTGRDYASSDIAGADLPTTLIAGGELAAGDHSGTPRSTQQSTVRLASSLHLSGGGHRLKLGLDVSQDSYESTFDSNGANQFLFAGLDEFESGQGMFVGTPGSAFGGSFSVPVIALFAQDRWAPLRDVELLFGVRYDTERLPTGEIRLNQDWLDRTGIDNREAPSSVGGISPRAALTWDVGQRHEWVVRATGGAYIGRLMPELWAEPLALDAGLQVSRGMGDLSSWPAAPLPDVAPVLGSRIALMDPDARAPRTTRGAVGVSRYLGAGTSLHLTGTLRRTDFLPRRSDLNLLPEPIFTDQHDRPVYGQLQLSGGLLAAAGGSNRRFVDVERADVINTDGWSEYRGLTVALERSASRWMTILGSYTLSTTRDNWSTRFPLHGSIDPFPGDSALAEWTEGTSDLDAPHRAVLGAELRAPAFPALSLAGLYRFRSGLPFTPSLHAGIDANADGFAGNDPAYVDGAIAGMDRLLGEWSCLREQQGGFADRNSCRSESAHSLDLRLALRLAARTGFSGELFIDGVDLIRGGGDFPDPALYLLDPAGTLETDATAGSVSVPLMANPDFGTPLAGTAPGRTIRIGVRINY